MTNIDVNGTAAQLPPPPSAVNVVSVPETCKGADQVPPVPALTETKACAP
jgi:hypothetical protein